MRTIPRSHRRKIEQLRTELDYAEVFDVDGKCQYIEIEPERAWRTFDDVKLAHMTRLVDMGNGTFQIQVHSNKWYRLSRRDGKGATVGAHTANVGS